MCQVKSPWLRLTSCMAPFHLLNNFHRKRLWKIGLSNWKAFQEGQKWAKPPVEVMKQIQATASRFQSVKEGLRWGTCWRDILTLYMQLLRIRKWFTLHHHHRIVFKEEPSNGWWGFRLPCLSVMSREYSSWKSKWQACKAIYFVSM